MIRLEILQEFSRRGSRNGHQTVRTFYKAAAGVDSRDENFFRVQIIQTDRAADNVDNRINRADFVESDRFRRALMNFSFRRRNDAENCKRTILDGRIQIGGVENFFYVAKRAVTVIFCVLMSVQMSNVRAIEFRFKIAGKFHVNINRADTVLADV